jgi:hypothetical protein
VNQFLQDFLPNLTATIVGVVIGLPVALFVNRQLTKEGDQRASKLERVRVATGLGVLRRSLQYNRKVLDNIATLAREGTVMRDPDLQSDTWDAVGSILTPILDDPRMLQRVSHHWQRLKRIEELNREIFDRNFGLRSAIPDTGSARGLWGNLYDLAVSLSAHTEEIEENLKELLMNYEETDGGARSAKGDCSEGTSQVSTIAPTISDNQ